MKQKARTSGRIGAYAGPALIYLLGSALTLFLAGSRWLAPSKRRAARR